MVTRRGQVDSLLVVSVIAVHNMRGHETVQHPRDNLNADESGDEGAHHDEARRLLRDPAH